MFTPYNFDKEQIKSRLRACREGDNPRKKRYTQVEFAQKIRAEQGIELEKAAGRSTVSTWEQADKSIPGIEDVLTICNVLEMDFDAFIGRATIASKDLNAVMEATGLDENALHRLKSHPENAVFVNHLLQSDSFSQIVKCSNQLAASSIIGDVIRTAFEVPLIKLVDKWFYDYYYSCFPMDMSMDSYTQYIRKHCKLSGDDLFRKYFLEEGRNFILNQYENFSTLSEREKYAIATDTIAQISYDYLISTNVMALSRKRIIDMFAEILDNYIEKQADKLHAHIKTFAENAKQSQPQKGP